MTVSLETSSMNKVPSFNSMKVLASFNNTLSLTVYSTFTSRIVGMVYCHDSDLLSYFIRRSEGRFKASL